MRVPALPYLQGATRSGTWEVQYVFRKEVKEGRKVERKESKEGRKEEGRKHSLMLLFGISSSNTNVIILGLTSFLICKILMAGIMCLAYFYCQPLNPGLA